MADMLVKLYELPELAPVLAKLQKAGVEIRRALAPEKHVVLDWVRTNFNPGWASECDVTFGNKPISSFVAVENGNILGFSCYNATCKDFFGPTGVHESQRSRNRDRNTKGCLWRAHRTIASTALCVRDHRRRRSG